MTFVGRKMVSQPPPSWDGLLDRMDPDEFSALKAKSIADGEKRARRREVVYGLLAGLSLAVVLEGWGCGGGNGWPLRWVPSLSVNS